ncbi:porin [uncultured Psychromonas sp.]|uniref:porin n=1 Tax=uncultured Psychromonas sp. TaxID=173974 RepID=UPI00261078FA|nr:porin [uncultured Psychromonas sp.]
MKKTILATMLTSLFAVSAHSATVYDADGMTLDVYGDVEVQAGKGTADGSAKMIKLDDADFGLQVGYKVGEDLTAIGVVSITGEDEDDGVAQVNLDDAYVGLSSAQWGTLTMGKQVTISDDIGIGNDFELGIESGYGTADDDYYGGRQVVKYTVDKGNYYGGISYLLNTGELSDNVESIDAKLGVRLDALDLTAYLGKTTVGSEDSTSVILEARYAIDALSLEATAGTTNGLTDADDLTNFGLAAVYSMDKAFVSGGWSITDTDGPDDQFNTYFANVGYAFNSNVTTYVEVGSNDKDDSEVGYYAGMAVSF